MRPGLLTNWLSHESWRANIFKFAARQVIRVVIICLGQSAEVRS